jgi:LPS export ABC transporter protein LptC
MRIAVGAITACALCYGCNPQPAAHASTPPTTGPQQSMPPLTITGRGTKSHPATFTAQNGNRRVYQLVAKSYVSHSEQNAAQASFNQPSVTFYGKDGTKLTATSPTAALQGGKEVVLTGGVHAVTSTGMTLTCDTLTYDQSSETIHGSGHVRITGMQGGAQQTLTGNRFTSDVKLTNMVIN